MRYVYIAVGCVTLALGTLGVVLPILPSVPFFLVTLYCFSHSSQRLHDWFVGTGLYQKNLRSYVQERGMNRAPKLRVMAMVTLLLGIGFVMMHSLWARVVLGVVWLGHVVYFMGVVRSLPEE